MPCCKMQDLKITTETIKFKHIVITKITNKVECFDIRISISFQIRNMQVNKERINGLKE